MDGGAAVAGSRSADAGLAPPTGQVDSLFETPLIRDVIPGAAELNAVLSRTIAQARASTPGVRKSNIHGWQSGPDMMRWGGEAAQTVARHFVALCDRYTAEIDPRARDRKPFRWYIDQWANVSRRGASNEYHCHPGAVWSAVYYVSDGYAGSDDAALGGEIVFRDPRMPMTRMLPLDLRYRDPDGEIGVDERRIRPITGGLLMFPPWLMHAVQPYHGDGDRISIAMNVTAIRV